MYIKLGFSVITLIFLLFSTFSSNIHAQETEISRVVQEYDGHREAYKKAYANEQARYENEQKNVLANKKEVFEEIESLENTKKGIQLAIMGEGVYQTVLNTIRLRISYFIFPFPTSVISNASAFLGHSEDDILKIGLPIIFLIWAIILFLVVKRHPRPHALNRKVIRWLSILLILSLVLMSPSLFADDEMTKEQKLKRSLELTASVFSMSDHERYLGILLSGNLKNIILPELKSGSEYLTIYRNVDTGTGEAYFTIAAIATFIGRNGEAIDALKRLSDPNIPIKAENRDYIITQTLKYLIKSNQTEAASDMLEANLKRLTNTEQIISLSEFLTEQGLQSSAEKTLKQAINNAKTTEDLLELGSFLYSKNKQTEGIEALVKAAKYVKHPQQYVDIAETWSGHGLTVPENFLVGMASIYRKARNRGEKSLLDYQLEMVAAIFRNNQVENAVQLFSKILADQKKVELEDYRQLLDFALANNWYEQATMVVRDLVRKLPSNARFDVTLRPNVKLEAEVGLPDSSKLSLPVLYGLLNEEQGFDDKAVTSYINSIQHALKDIQSTLGYNAKYSLNNFYLLGRQYKKSGNMDMLAALDKTYTLLEQQTLSQLKLNNENELKNMRSMLDDAGELINALKVEIEQLKRSHKKELWNTTYQTVSIAGTVLFLLILLIGCIIWSIDYSKQQSSNKLSAFSAKFLEVGGWVKIYSILGAISGAFFVLLGQTWIIFQRKHEELKAFRMAAVGGRQAINKSTAGQSGNSE